ncbi:hypothetical protein AO501_24510 [Mycobacterium gordonae]|uniref:Uncharacterized protein n=1 Tax=Mycobacterium gordonae TaxID=1778 RepID=A0A0Q2QTJ4_MYCGO|nr:hypothetical protein AO501_24510 [Mycobacterium gordonae]
MAKVMRDMAKCLKDDDRTALELRASAIAQGYTPEILQQLTNLSEDIVVVAGQLSTWFGKEVRGLPSAFGARVDAVLQGAVQRVAKQHNAVDTYLRSMHPALRQGVAPVFAATRIFYCAGEANNYPKHIAYFLPEDEGVKHSTYKKTYYFANTHNALISGASAPLAKAHLDLGRPFDSADAQFKLIPTLGVLAHEHGHFVHRAETDYEAINQVDRWCSVAMQEIAADVFGTLILSDVWASTMDVDPDDVIVYHLAECLRYVGRGLGIYPDSDGMGLQLEYLLRLGALELHAGVLRGNPGTVRTGLRSLARVLADHLLGGNGLTAIDFFATYGPPGLQKLLPLVHKLAAKPIVQIHYGQEWLNATAPGPV